MSEAREAITLWRDERGRFYARWNDHEFGPSASVGKLLDSVQVSLWFDHERTIGIQAWAEPRSIGSVRPTGG